MINRLLRWTMWSPAHLAISVAGVLLLLVATAFVFRPGSDSSPPAASVTTGAATPSETVKASTPPPTASPTPNPSVSPSATPTPTVAPADAGAVADAAASHDVEQLYTRFTTTWLTGLGALTVPGWADDVCAAGCTPYLRQMLGTTSTAAIPDATLKVVRVQSVGDTRAVGRAQLSNGLWLQLTADWDGERWLVAGIEQA